MSLKEGEKREMALIKCPECGRENVSDTAESCPNCGYGIKAHYEKIKKEQEQEERRKRAEIAEKKAREKAEEREKERMQAIPQLEAPRLFAPITTIIISVIFIIFSFSQMTVSDADAEYSMAHGDGDPHLLGAIGVIFGICLIIGGFYWIKSRMEEYNLSKNNLEEYRKQVIREQDIQAKLKAQEEAREKAKKAECPYCHSRNTVKISKTAKAVNTAVFGVVGQKRKYQWHCNNCKSDF